MLMAKSGSSTVQYSLKQQQQQKKNNKSYKNLHFEVALETGTMLSWTALLDSF